MNYPPIPPNCKAFGKYNDGTAYVTMPCNNGRWQIPLEELGEFPELHRMFIASVARCAWLDEAHRRYCEDDADALFCPNIACDNAEAWRKWSRGEAWE